MTMIRSTLTKALKDYFGYKPGQNLTDFMAEIKALTPEDKAYFRREFLKVGYEIIEAEVETGFCPSKGYALADETTFGTSGCLKPPDTWARAQTSAGPRDGIARPKAALRLH
jgi:hypothetical protein